MHVSEREREWESTLPTASLPPRVDGRPKLIPEARAFLPRETETTETRFCRAGSVFVRVRMCVCVCVRVREKECVRGCVCVSE